MSVRAVVEGFDQIDRYASVGDQFGALVDLLAAGGFALVPLRRDRAAADHHQQEQHGGDKARPRSGAL